MNLRPYQESAVADLRAAYGAGRRAPLFVLPTGGGKTFVFCYVSDQAVSRGNRVLILVHRQELLLQASRSLDTIGIKHGLISPAFPESSMHPVQVASVQTLIRRLARGHYKPDLIIVDEAHHATAGSWRKVIDAFPKARVLGVTATPVRTDGTGLGEIFDEMVVGPSIGELIRQGFLVKPVVYGPPVQVDLKGVRKRGGDWDAKDLATRVDKPKITGNAVEHYRKLCHGKPAIAFCASVEHSEHVAADFRANGYRAVKLDGMMDDKDRKKAIDDLANGRLDVIASCDIVSEGTDIPVVEAAILLRPTQSTSLFLQQVGRALRPAPGKDRAIILDHVGNCLRHGMPDDDRDWSLEGVTAKHKAANDNDGPPIKQCEKCYAVFHASPVCPQCGHVHEIKGRKLEEDGGELEEITEARAAMIRAERKREEREAKSLEDLQELAKKRGYSPGWAYFRFKARERGRISA